MSASNVTRRVLVDAFFSFLHHSNIRYAILGDSTDIQFKQEGDIDLVVDATAWDDLVGLVGRFCTAHQALSLNITNVINHENNASYIVVSSAQIAMERVEHLVLDFCFHYEVRNRLYLSNEFLLGGVRKASYHGIDFYVAADVSNFIYYLVKRIMKGVLDDKQLVFLRSLWSVNSKKIMLELESSFDKDFCSCVERVMWQPSAESLSRLMEHRDALVGCGRRTWINKLANFLRLTRRILAPTGLVVAFYGSDGSGKTSIINELLTKSTNTVSFRRVTYHHLYPQRHFDRPRPVTTDPHGQVARGVWLSIIKVIFLWFRYTLGYFFLIYPQKIQSGLVVFDRYYFDLLIDPVRYRHGAGDGIINFVGRFIPRPDISIFVDVEPDRIFSRKQELSIEELKLQQARLHALCLSHRSHVIVRNDGDLNRTIFDVLRVVDAAMISREQRI